MKVTTPKQKELNLVERLVKFTEDNLSKLPNGMKEYRIPFNDYVRMAERNTIGDLYINAGWNVEFDNTKKTPNANTETTIILKRN